MAASTDTLTSNDATSDADKLHVLCVDLDGTLIRTDLSTERMISVLRQPWAALRCLFGAGKRQGSLIERLNASLPFDISQLPYNETLLDFLKDEKRSGRHLVLATTNDFAVAQEIAMHLGLFDEVVASSKGDPLEVQAKARRLSERYGVGGFSYAGNNPADIPIWEKAGAAVIVNASDRFVRRISTKIEAIFPPQEGNVRLMMRALRVHQWVKNVLVFVPVIAAGALFNLPAVAASIVAFFLFCALASGIYLLNDLLDLEADRAHPTKRHRPVASGALHPRSALYLGLTMCFMSLAISILVAPSIFLVLVCYAIANLAYSLTLKTQPLVDVFLLTGLYALRIVGGGVASGYAPSIWLLSFSCLFFLSLAFLKRVSEIANSTGARLVRRRGYYAGEVQPLMTMGIASSFAAAVVLALYVNTDVAHSVYQNPHVIWGFVPLCLFWQCRLWLSAARGYVHDDPVVYACKDWVTWMAAIIAVGLYCSAHLIPSLP